MSNEDDGNLRLHIGNVSIRMNRYKSAIRIQRKNTLKENTKYIHIDSITNVSNHNSWFAKSHLNS